MPGTHGTASLLSLWVCQCLACRYPGPHPACLGGASDFTLRARHAITARGLRMGRGGSAKWHGMGVARGRFGEPTYPCRPTGSSWSKRFRDATRYAVGATKLTPATAGYHTDRPRPGALGRPALRWLRFGIQGLDRLDNQYVLAREDGAQIKQQAVVLHAPANGPWADP